ncbi:PepSY domain-containing protein [Candidatus Gracilibacteria bacterium]|jgi:uncharacterized iron-regulated membrane protein|nr:PepSY domain-containing protein [Candidatus Gracilibacteria bacterium]NJM90557.1 PepSY domain-containing protein [Hydrococcus sp. RU_2_2]NJP19918.1 PepSY domain-containing protein [Hydrococcus sp. CRU_1_1]
MKTKFIRNLTFHFHRVLGLILGIIVSIVGLTGSLLVFEGKIDRTYRQQIKKIKKKD